VYDIKAAADSSGLQSSCICRHETGINAVMNCASFYDGRHHQLATGEDELCRTYSVKYKVITPGKAGDASTADTTSGVRQRKGEKSSPSSTCNGDSSNSNGQSASGQKQMTFQIEKKEEAVTDFPKEKGAEGFQKCVRFFPDFSHLVTGGSDGHVRVWKYPSMKKVTDVDAHKNEIDDLDVSPDGSKIVTISRDKNGSVWNVKDGKKVCDLVWDQKTGTDAYRFKACRFGLVEDKKDKYNLYSVNIPVARSDKLQCFISLWDGSKHTLRKTAKTGVDVLSAFTVSNTGTFLGVGTITGDVAVYISFSLQKLYSVKEAHSYFVTGVEFMPASQHSKDVMGEQDFSLLSISADNTVRLRQCPERTFISPMWPILAMVVIIYFLFTLMAEMGL